MNSVNVRISKRTHQQLTSLARTQGLSMQTVLDQAVEAYRRQAFLQSLNADFAALRANPSLWQEELEERNLFDQTLADGLEEQTS